MPDYAVEYRNNILIMPENAIESSMELSPPPSTPKENFKLIFFVQPAALDTCKTAVFEAGAGIQGKYTECCFISSGKGQFRPGEGSNPRIGEVGRLEEVEEVRCEVLCKGRDIAVRAVEALKKAHPYEEVPYEVYKLEDI